MRLVRAAALELGRSTRQAAGVSLTLFKVMVPIIVAVKILEEMDLIRHLATPLEPFMALVGLPADMGLAWATAMINNIYGGIIVFVQLADGQSVSAAQATVLGTMMLIAHGLPVELKIASLAGPRIWFQAVLRVGGALACGYLLHRVYTGFGLLQGPAEVAFAPARSVDETLADWALGEAVNLISIFAIIWGLMVLMRLLKALRLTDLMNRLLSPLLKLMGIRPEAAQITVVGLTLGLSYGGGLIINEAERGEIGPRDVFYSVSLMGLCHSLFEDTLLLMLIGGHVSGLFWGRLAFSLLVTAVLVRLARRLPEPRFERLLSRRAAAPGG